MYDKIDRILDRRGEEELQAHLEHCDLCAREYQQVLALHSLYSEQTMVKPTTDLVARVLAEITTESPRVARARFRQVYWERISVFAQALAASLLLYFSAPYFLASKPLWDGFRLSWQIFDIDLSFLGSLSLPDISSLVLGLAPRALQGLALFSQNVAAHLQPNLLAVVAGLLLLQIVGNKLLFSSLRS